MSLLFAATLFVSAVLLFWVQPLVGKLLLPLLGGTPAVWNTCLLFFQAALLGGYAYALALTRWLGGRAQIVVHLALLVAAAVSLPVAASGAVAAGAPAGASPVGWLLVSLLGMVGLPFFALSASAPLLQKWFAGARAEGSGDPYFLYSASNAGSLCALLGFPLLLEPNWTLAEQGRNWAFLYAALALLVAACGAAAWRRSRVPGREAGVEDGPAGENSELGAQGLSWRERLRWTLLAFVPSSLVLGATTYITTDVASAPLLWVLPLALYLLSFVIVFARRELFSWRAAARLLPGAGVLVALVYLSGATEPAWFLILFHLLFLFVAAVVCHGQLASERPAPSRLAEFYLWLSVGGALGGLFNAVVAPLVFDSVAEYPLVIVLACLLRPAFRKSRFRLPGLGLAAEPEAEAEAPADERRELKLDVAYAAGAGLFVVLLALAVRQVELQLVEKVALVLGVPLLLLNHLAAHRPLRFALGLGAVMLAGLLVGGRTGETVYAERNFFGTLRVSLEESQETLRLYHGSTLHGRQYTDPARACEPLSYYHRQGPLGSVFAAFDAKPQPSAAVAVVGLGTGASAAYARPGQRWTFYEIDPAVERIARGPQFFTYLSNCAAAPVEVVLGDARLKLRGAAPAGYGLVVLDAFSSDAVPAHLLTREALDLYLSKLAPGGLIAYHTSNRSLNLERVAGGIAREAGLVARVFNDSVYEPDIQKEPSEWVVVARRESDLGALASDPRWKPLDETTHRLEVWRDDFSDILSVFKWL